MSVPTHYDEAKEEYVIDCPFPMAFDPYAKAWDCDGGQVTWDDVMERWRGRGPGPAAPAILSRWCSCPPTPPTGWCVRRQGQRAGHDDGSGDRLGNGRRRGRLGVGEHGRGARRQQVRTRPP